MSASVKPSFGFGDLSDIQPTAPAPRESVTPEIDRVGEQLGFQSREAPPRRRKKRMGSDEPIDQINIRASVSDLDRFVEWCERNRYSYREGFGALVRLIDRV
jgi:hypothetical protein